MKMGDGHLSLVSNVWFQHKKIHQLHGSAEVED